MERAYSDVYNLVMYPTESRKLEVKNNNYYQCQLHLKGPENTPYAGGNFIISIDIPSNYPAQVPSLKFDTLIYHPNVNSQTGEFSQYLLQHYWTQDKTLTWLIDTLLQFLAQPSEYYADTEIYNKYRYDYNTYYATGQQWTQYYASAATNALPNYSANPNPGYVTNANPSYSPNPSYSANPNPGYSANPNPGYATNPNPGYSANPNPGYSANPNPGYSTNPNPGYSTNPNPGYSTNPVPSYSTNLNPGFSTNPVPSYSANPNPVPIISEPTNYDNKKIEADNKGNTATEINNKYFECCSCGYGEIDLVLKECRHTYHLNCFNNFCSKCNKNVEINPLPTKKKPAEGCSHCGALDSLSQCGTCGSILCILCLNTKVLPECCEKIHEYIDWYKSECPGCNLTVSFKEYLPIKCPGHSYLCRKCLSLSFALGKCLLGCELPVPLNDFIRCQMCRKVKKPFYSELKCSNQCKVCEVCQWESNLKLSGEQVPKCVACSEVLGN